MKSTNLTVRNLGNYCSGEDLVSEEKNATYLGVAIKALILIAITIVSAIFSARLFYNASPTLTLGLIIASAIGALVTGIIAQTRPHTTKITGAIYAVCEGLLVGFICAIATASGIGGIIVPALFSTLITFAVMTALYATRLIKVGKGLVNFLLIAGIGLFASQLLLFIVTLIFPAFGAFIYLDTPLMIFVSAFMVIYASFFLLIDLNTVASVVEGGMSKQYEWNASFGLVVTLIWIYIEFLRLFMLLARFRRK